MNKTKKKVVNKKTSETNELRNLIILIVVIVVVLSLVYFITKLFEKHDYSDIFNNSLATTEIQYKDIMVGTIFQQAGKEYYVLVIDDTASTTSILNSYVEEYQQADHKVKMYTIDLNNVMNKTAKDKKSNFDKDNLKFKGTTLLKIKDKEIVETIEDFEKINDRFLELNK